MLLLQQIVDAVGVVATFLSGAEDTVPIRTITRISGFVGFVMKLQLDDLIVCLSEGDLNAKLNLLDELKYTVKHHTVPEDAFPNLFRAISIGISDGSSADATLPIIPVLVRRLCNQNQQDVIEAHAAELAGVLVDRLGDGNDSTRKQAVASLIDLWPYFPDLEKLVKEQVLSSHNNHTKVCGMRLAVLVSFLPVLLLLHVC